MNTYQKDIFLKDINWRINFRSVELKRRIVGVHPACRTRVGLGVNLDALRFTGFPVIISPETMDKINAYQRSI